MVTDGADTSDTSIDDPLASLKARSIPVFTVGVGQERFARDIQLTRVETPRTALKGTALVVNVVVSLLCRVIFDFALWSEREEAIPVLLVCDEAHRYIPRDEKTGFELSIGKETALDGSHVAMLQKLAPAAGKKWGATELRCTLP